MASDYSNAPDLEDTSDRQAALRRYHILDTAPEKDFDRITSLVAKVCDVSTALITLIDEERQWFKSCFNFDARETDIGISFCVHAVHNGEMLVVEDATEDPRFKDNPIVTGPPHIRFYAGAPLTTPEGLHIGTLCIIDYEPQPFDAAQREILDRLSEVVVSQFELRSAEAQIRQLVDQNPQPMYVYAQSDGSLLHANAAAHDLYGYDEGTLSTLTAAALEAPSAEQPATDDLSLHERADGSFVPVRLREREVLFDGRAAVLAVPQRMSERPETKTTVFFQTDLEGTTQSVSAEWTEATGFEIGDTVGTSFLEFIHPLDRAETSDLFSALLDGEMDTCRHETSILTEDGAQAFELHARLVRDAEGTPTGAAGTLTPIIEEAPDADDVAEPEVEAEAPAPDKADDAAPADDATSEADGEDGPVAPVAEEGADDEGDGPVPPTAGDDVSETEVAEEEVAPDAAAEVDDASDPAPAVPDDETDDEPAPAPAGPAPDAEPEADPAPAAETDAPAESPAAEEEDDEGSLPNSVFSADLPSFDAEPSSPSAPINGPSDASSSSPGADERPLSPSPFDFTAHVGTVLDDEAPTDRHPEVSLHRMLPDASVSVRLDPEAVREVVTALLDHAFDHAEDGAVKVEAESTDARVGLRVTDTGPDLATRLPDGSEDDAIPDDLHEAERLVEQMGGVFEVRDRDEAGMDVRVALPRSAAPTGNGSASILSDA